MSIRSKIYDFFKPQPVSGGNSFVTHIELKEQIERNIQSQNMTIPPTADIDVNQLGLNKKFGESNYDFYRMLSFEADYYCNRWPFLSDSAELQRKVMIVIRTAFFYGVACLYKFQSRYYPCYIQKAITANSGEYIYLVLRPAGEVLGQATANPKFSKEMPRFIVKGENLLNVAVYEWDTTKMGAYYRFSPFINQKQRIAKMLTSDVYTYFKSHEYNVTDPDNLKKEMDLYFDEDLPFKIKVGVTEAGQTNKFKTAEHASTTTSLPFIQYVEFWQKFWYSTLGRRTNMDQKRERNITSEVEASQSAIDVLENDNYLHYLIFLKEVERITDMKFSLYDSNSVKKIDNTLHTDEEDK